MNDEVLYYFNKKISYIFINVLKSFSYGVTVY